MSQVTSDKSCPTVSKVWLALRRLDQNDDRVVALRHVSIPQAERTTIIQILSESFGVNTSNVVFKIRNQRGRLIPINSSIPANSKHIPHVLEITRFFQHVQPKPRIIPTAVINNRMKTYLQNMDRRIQRLSDLLPQMKQRHDEKLTEDIEYLNQTLCFLHKKMEVVDSYSWKGTLTRSPLW